MLKHMLLIGAVAVAAPAFAQATPPADDETPTTQPAPADSEPADDTAPDDKNSTSMEEPAPSETPSAEPTPPTDEPADPDQPGEAEPQ